MKSGGAGICSTQANCHTTWDSVNAACGTLGCCALNSVTTTPGGCNDHWYCGGGNGCKPPNGIACGGGTYQGNCIIYHCPQGCGGNNTTCGESSPGVSWEYAPCSTASFPSNECGQIDTVSGAIGTKGPYCSPPSPYCDVKALNCSCTVKTPTPTPPTQCINIIAYKDGNALSQDELNALHPGDTITLAFAPGGAATKVRFRVNAGTWNETTTKNANGQFVWNYTLENATSFTIEAQWYNGTKWN